MIYFVGPGFELLPLQHDLFVGPGFDSLALIACFWPVVSLAYIRCGISSRAGLVVVGVAAASFAGSGFGVVGLAAAGLVVAGIVALG